MGRSLCDQLQTSVYAKSNIANINRSQRSISAMDSRLFSEHEVIRNAQPETQLGVGLTDSDAIRRADSSVLRS